MSNTTNLENTLEIIGQGMDLLLLPEDSNNNESRQLVHTFLNTAANSYVLVEWPESQEFMDEDWFEEEAVCAVGSEDRFGSAAYFIPLKRVIN